MEIIQRAQAKARQLKRYYTGTPCKHGHLAERLVSNGSCMECFGLRQRANYHANLAESRLKQKIRRDSDPSDKEKRLARKLRHDPTLLDRRAERESERAARGEAKASGLTKYTSARPCSAHGHIGLRFVADGKCVECNRLGCLGRYHSRNPQLPFRERRTLAQVREDAALRKEARAAETKAYSDAKASRSAAIESGQKTYFGRPCPRGHSGNRYTGDGACVECAAAYSSSAEKKAYDAQYAVANRDRIRAQHREYNQRAALKILEGARRWAAANPDKVRAIKQAYKARRRCQEDGGDPTSVLREWEAAAAKVCYWCGAKCRHRYHVDHYQPLSKGGLHVVSNLVIACPRCNLKKSAKDPYDFAASVGRLF